MKQFTNEDRAELVHALTEAKAQIEYLRTKLSPKKYSFTTPTTTECLLLIDRAISAHATPEPSEDKYMDKCLADLDFGTNEEYYEYCVESHINGQLSQCKELFNAMPTDNKHALIDYIRINHGNDAIHNFFVNLF